MASEVDRVVEIRLLEQEWDELREEALEGPSACRAGDAGDYRIAIDRRLAKVRGMERQLREALEREHAELLREVREWICEQCATVYPGAPQPGIACVVCPACKGPTMPYSAWERRKLTDRLAVLEALRVAS